ncbi:hypothetical protein [Deferribacter abyssi]|uniref:hypothetical protein n=1 Tax=Deferribacter abyssi TaxID=213806 RepID=UPI003C1EB25E
MLKYDEIIRFLKKRKLLNKHIAEITGLSISYIQQNYGLDKCYVAKFPNKRVIEIAKLLIIKRGKNFLEVLKILSEYDANILYESLSDILDKQYLNVVDIFFQDASKLLQLGLSLRQVCKLLEYANDGFTPDHSSLRKTLIKKGLYNPKIINLNSQKITLRDKKKILLYIQRNNLKLRIEDFMLLYSKFSDVHVKILFELLENSENYEIKKCICCGKEYLFRDKKNRLCSNCRNKTSFDNHYGVLSI